ncbi:uncharacterized protein [Palaemon carinicauda]|uniref:uncharacterized protein isoform X2 n=1 Tax=Palaemon carinicauda TaxID=392227 RepID=UPI0035B58A1B
MRSWKWCWSKSICFFVIISTLCCEGFQVSRASTECMKHISTAGINSEDILAEGDSVTFRYYVKKDDLLKPEDDLYTLHWDDDIMPLYVAEDLRFCKFFEVDEKNQTLRIRVKKASLVNRNFYRGLRPVEFRRVFGQSMDSANCTIILRHYFTCMSKSSKQTRGIFAKKCTATTKNQKLNSTSLLENYTNSGDLPTTSGHYPELDYDTRRPSSSIHAINDVIPDVGRNALVDVTAPSVTTTTVSNDPEFNLQLTVGIIGGLLGLMFVIGVGVGIYYNYKKGVRLGVFQRRPKETKTITTLGSIYPNIVCNDNEMREKAQVPEDPSAHTPYPNYAYANPAATEPVPLNHRLI